MSEAVIQQLARRWNCSRGDVARVIYKRLENAGLVKTGFADEAAKQNTRRPPQGVPEGAEYFTLGVDGDRIFVLDENDVPILELR